MTRARPIRLPAVERLLTTLSDRDWAIIDTVDRLHLVSGFQLERLYFSPLSTRSRSVVRWRVLKRLVDARVLIPFERRIGSAQHGSDKLVYALDSAGLQLMRLRANANGSDRVVRRPRLPGERFVAHMLGVSELYVGLVERTRVGRFVLDDYAAEPAAWVKDGLGGWLKPDAFTKVRHGDVRDYWWIEMDMGTESPSTVRGKLLTYLGFVEHGQAGPDGVVPRVLICVPDEKRRAGIQRVVNSLPTPADYMFHVVEQANSALHIEQVLAG